MRKSASGSAGFRRKSQPSAWSNSRWPAAHPTTSPSSPWAARKLPGSRSNSRPKPMPEAGDPARTVFQPGPSGDGERPGSEQGRRETTRPPPPHETMPPAASIAPERTVFQPQPEEAPPPPEEGLTVFQPRAVGAAQPREASGAGGADEKPETPLPSSIPPPAAEPSTPAPGSWRPGAPQLEGGQIPIGTVLNHIYRVDRLVARGGMGEVYEGTNISDAEDRVAIKIVLQHLAADPNVQALFRAEARTLTRLAHPGLVQYRLLALEPQLDVLYIVTEFVDGPALSEVLSTIEVPPDGLAQFIRRMASALAAAHALGKVHRDMSPDNILLPHALLDQAKIIDFGIAKDLEGAQGKTIVGSGFAGKLAYVAPEQFGESKDVGPWTDVYSLGLVALAVVLRGTPDMGATFAEAVERRQQVPDLSSVPPLLRPLLARMLQPDRLQRYQSMNEVVAAIDRIPRLQLQAPRDIPAENTTKRALSAGGVPERAQEKAPRNFAIWAATAAVVVIAAALVFGPEMFNAPEVMHEG